MKASVKVAFLFGLLFGAYLGVGFVLESKMMTVPATVFVVAFLILEGPDILHWCARRLQRITHKILE